MGRSLTLWLAVLLAVQAAAVPAGAHAEELPATVPAPARWSGAGGSFQLTPESRILAAPQSAELAGLLGEHLREATGLAVPVVTGPVPEPAPGDVRLVREAGTGGPEGYRMEIGDHVEIGAPEQAGLFYGGRTLLQLLGADRTAPRGTLEDRPALRTRMVILDVQRGFWPAARIQDLIRRMAWLKLNTLHLRLSGDAALRLSDPAPSGPAFAAAVPARHYTRADIDAVQAVAARHHVTVVPEIDVLDGTAALTPVRRCAGEHVPDLADAEVRKRLAAVLDTFSGWFGAGLVGLGRVDACDEPEWREGARELIAHAVSLGRRPVLTVRDRVPPLEGEPVILHEAAPETRASARSGEHDVVDVVEAAGWYAGDLLRQDPGAGGSGRALLAEITPFGDPGAAEAALAGPLAEFAERAWNRDSPAEGFSARLGAVGGAPGLLSENPRAGGAEHRYGFDGLHVPAGGTHAPAAWRQGLLVSAADGAGGARPDEGAGGTPPEEGGVHATAEPGRGAAPWFPVPGRLGTAARFGEGRRFTLGGASAPPPWTVSMWVRSEDRARGTLLGGLGQAIVVDGGEIAVSGVREFAFGYRLPLNRWTHLVLVATPGGTTLHADGRRIGTVPEVIGLPAWSMGPFGGALDEVAMSGTALTDRQARERHRADSIGPDLALGRPATASGVESGELGPEKAVDGDPDTRWGSVKRADPQWIQVDLGAARKVGRVVLHWERAYGSRYRIEGSPDGVSWTVLREVGTGDGGVDEVAGLSAVARHVRVHGVRRGTGWGYSLMGLSVYEG
ncbi:discoidin domain-containing protein [Planomonospora sp. ID67723]|uniref:discoidin domain-containing protein n=1 Tax=Planomonospora sp. ID67723 TaxID=2738134 RepID=UPI0018C3D180|nr:discoidin domain-containing protein [Planomonospora sp. ID67723]MBG0828818.1 discoidin domain-containing protein [Planomonospora sp. ID67723]